MQAYNWTDAQRWSDEIQALRVISLPALNTTMNLTACSVGSVKDNSNPLGRTNYERRESEHIAINLLKPTGHVMHQQFNIQQL
jgi:hypothetical protein